MHSKRLTKSERVWLRGALIAECHGREDGHGWNTTVRDLISRGMARQIPGTFATSSGGLELRYRMTPRGRACARQLWWSRLHGPRTPRGFSSRTYNPLLDRALGGFISFTS